MEECLSTRPEVVAVVVTYKPDIRRLQQLLKAVEPQVQCCVIVDNGSPTDTVLVMQQILTASQHLIASPENHGIAVAQNMGLAHARECGAEYVFLLDQDSVPSSGTVARLLSHIKRLASAGVTAGAIGPRLADERWDSAKRLAPRGQAREFENLLEVDHIIASGSIIPMPVVDRIGGMKAELFIDYVDIEWCLRASRHGYPCFIATDVVMDHQLGAPMKVLGRVISTHSPMRHYYMVRNTLWMIRQPWLPARWRFGKVPKIALHLLINAVFARPHLAHWRMMGRGLAHGLSGRMGKGHD